MDWHDYKSVFLKGGGLKKIVIKDVNLEDWQRLINFLRSTEAKLNLYLGSEKISLPDNIKNIVVSAEYSYKLVIALNTVKLVCGFANAQKIEFTFNSAEVDKEIKAKVIFRFMSTMGRTLNKHVVLIQGNGEGESIFEYFPGEGLKYL
ncbi:hypothetical protein KCM76_13845 [Zooshikella marina]|uniref:hypothetical protein n=1 Tax=Zooshikella ganghwensis TaxID=202772 RepID=UPI001BAEC614|nr:hypothetical protein [Zooshikella ganghwensis]MBU2707073.1 hypothetical protein [Zooshikella ganghwensis]